jgi:hypothetical protein
MDMTDAIRSEGAMSALRFEKVKFGIVRLLFKGENRALAR